MKHTRPATRISFPILLILIILSSASRLSAQPSAVEAIATGPTEVHVYWNAAPNAKSYQVYRVDLDPNTKVRISFGIGAADASAREFVDRTVVPGMTYAYSVVALLPDRD